MTTLNNDLRVMRDYVLNGPDLELVCDKLVEFVHRHVNPEDVYIYVLLNLGNYHQLISGYAYNLIDFYDEQLTPMQNHHRWNEALKLIEDQHEHIKYYKIVDDHFETVNHVDIVNGYRKLLASLIKLHVLPKEASETYNIAITKKQKETKIINLNVDNKILQRPSLFTNCLVG